MLYLPRGTVHQAVAQEGGSTHLTLSTYQNWTWGSLAACVVHTALDSQGEVRGKGVKGGLGSVTYVAEASRMHHVCIFFSSTDCIAL